MSIRVKICGLSDLLSLQAALSAGADYVGFVHFPRSPRHVSLDLAKQLIDVLPNRSQSVMVLVDPDDALIEAVRSQVNPGAVQLHGKESPERVSAIKRLLPSIKIIKALPVQTAKDIAHANAYVDTADMLLFDASPPPAGGRPGGGHGSPNASLLTSPLRGEELPGGNGVSFDWTLLKNRPFEKPWFLSGGLNSGNVAEAVHITGAKMVDVSSGVESAPGVKDRTRILEFITAIKSL